MDKKSLNRLLDKLSKGGFLKNIIVKLKCGKLTKLLQFVVHPSITFGKWVAKYDGVYVWL